MIITIIIQLFNRKHQKYGVELHYLQMKKVISQKIKNLLKIEEMKHLIDH